VKFDTLHHWAFLRIKRLTCMDGRAQRAHKRDDSGHLDVKEIEKRIS